MKRLILIGLIVALAGAGVAWAAAGSLQEQTVGLGRVAELIPLEDGSAAIVLSDANTHVYRLYYVDHGVQQHSFDVPWLGEAEPALVVRACAQTVHLTLTAADGLTRYVVWDLPVEVSRVYVPVICVRH